MQSAYWHIERSLHWHVTPDKKYHREVNALQNIIPLIDLNTSRKEQDKELEDPTMLYFYAIAQYSVH